jgi:hypothetical protein
MSKKRDVWSDKETFELLAAWGAEVIQKKLQGVHKNTDIYKKVSEMMKEKKYIETGRNTEQSLNT